LADGESGVYAGYNDALISVRLATATEAILADSGDIKITTSGDYYHLGNQGVTGDGFSGGIKVDADAATSAMIESVEMYT